MAFYDRRTLDGVYSVKQSARYIMNYRYAEERMMRMMAGWIALTPEVQVKLEMARQVYEDALHADALGKRLAELRSQAQVSKPANELFVALMNEIEDKEEWEDTIERLVGIYRVLKPHLVSHYSAHVDAAEKHRRVALWQSHLEDLLAAAGGVTGFPEEEAERKKLGRS